MEIRDQQPGFSSQGDPPTVPRWTLFTWFSRNLNISGCPWPSNFGVTCCVVATLALAGCENPGPRIAAPPSVSDYSRPLAPGTNGLRKLTDASQVPDLTAAFLGRDAGLKEALERSLDWFEKPSTTGHFPILGISHEQARVSVFAMAWMLDSSKTPTQFTRRVLEGFDIYTSVGWNGQGEVLFTGYYTPVFDASLSRTGEFRYPLYRRPDDLVSDPNTGKVLGRRVGDQILPYSTRRELHRSKTLLGQELVWLRDPLEAYLVHVQGSALLRLSDGPDMHIGYAGNNGHEYTSIGQLLVKEGHILEHQLSIDAIRAYFRRHPGYLERYLLLNDRFIFFRTYSGEHWPSGSLGVKVTPLGSIATDKTVFPRGGVTLVMTDIPTLLGGHRRFEHFMVDQDTGGAIRAAGRADLYMGIGLKAEKRAGRQLATGRLYYFFVKPDWVQQWLDTMTHSPPTLTRLNSQGDG